MSSTSKKLPAVPVVTPRLITVGRGKAPQVETELRSGASQLGLIRPELSLSKNIDAEGNPHRSAFRNDLKKELKDSGVEDTGTSVEVLQNQVEKLQIEVTVKDLKNRRLQNELIISQKLLDIQAALMAKKAQVSPTPQPSNNFQSPLRSPCSPQESIASSSVPAFESHGPKFWWMERESRRRQTSEDRESQNPNDPDTHGETSHQQKEYRE